MPDFVVIEIRKRKRISLKYDAKDVLNIFLFALFFSPSKRVQYENVFIDLLRTILHKQKKHMISSLNSSLHWNSSLSFCLFSYNRVCQTLKKLSVSDVIVSQKDSNGDRSVNACVRENGALCQSTNLSVSAFKVTLSAS